MKRKFVRPTRYLDNSRFSDRRASLHYQVGLHFAREAYTNERPFCFTAKSMPEVSLNPIGNAMQIMRITFSTASWLAGRSGKSMTIQTNSPCSNLIT